MLNHRSKNRAYSDDGGNEAKTGTHPVDNRLSNLGDRHRPRSDTYEDAAK